AGHDQAELVAVPTVFDLLHKAGLRTAAIDWPCTRNSPSLDVNFPDVPEQGKDMTAPLREELLGAGGLAGGGGWGGSRRWRGGGGVPHVARAEAELPDAAPAEPRRRAAQLRAAVVRRVYGGGAGRQPGARRAGGGGRGGAARADDGVRRRRPRVCHGSEDAVS